MPRHAGRSIQVARLARREGKFGRAGSDEERAEILKEGMKMKLANDTLKMINQLPKEKRERVEAVVRRHIAACHKNGFPPENLDRVYLEAIEIVELDELYPEPEVEEIRDWEPARRYEQYVSPKAA